MGAKPGTEKNDSANGRGDQFIRLRPRSVRLKIILLVILLVIPLVLMGIAGTLYYQGVITQNINDDNLNSAKIVAALTPEYMNASELYLMSIADRPLVIKAMEENDLSFLHSMAVYANNTTRINGVYFTDGQGIIIESTPGYAGHLGDDVRDHSYVCDVLRAGVPVIGDAEPGVDQMPVVPIGVPVLNENGTVLGVMVGTVDIGEFSRIVIGTMVNNQQYTYLVNRTGHVMIHNNPDYVRAMQDFHEVPIVQHALQSESGTMESYNPIENQSRLGAYAPIEPMGWGAIVAVPVDVAYQPVWNATWLASVIISAFTLVILGVGLYVGNGIAGPIIDLSRATKNVDETDDYRKLLPLHRGDEIGEFARSFDDMVNAIREENRERELATLELRRSETGLKKSQEMAHLGSWELDLVNNTLSWSDEAYRIFGIQQQDFEATYEAFLEVVHPDDRAAVDVAYSHSVIDGKDHYEIEHRIVKKSNEEVRYVHEKCEHIRDTSGRVIKSVGMVHDITDRKRRDERIAMLTRLYVVLSKVNETIVRVHDAEKLLVEVCQIVAEEGGFPLVWIGHVEGQQVTPVAVCGPASGYLEEIKVEVAGTLGMGPTGTCIRECRAIVNDEFASNPSTLPWRELALSAGFQASAAFPLYRKGRVMGAFTLYASSAGAFDAEQLRLLQSLSADVSYALDAIDHEQLHLRAMESLRESEEKYRVLVENAISIIVRWSIDGRITFFNEYAEQFFGFRKGEVLGQDISMLLPGIDSTGRDLVAMTEDMKRYPELYANNVTENVRKDGELVWVSWTNKAIRDEQGRVIEMLSVGSDITLRRQAEESLRKLSLAVEESPATVIITDIHGNIEYVNPKFTQITGYSYEDAFGKNPRILKSGKTTPEEYKHLWDTILAGQEWRGEFLNRKKDGDQYWETAVIAPIKNAEGKITSFIAIKEDITERKLADIQREHLLIELKAKTAELQKVNEELEVKGEELAAQAEEIECTNEELRTNNEELQKVTGSLRETQDYLESLINYANAPIIVWDPRFTITRFNRAFERLSGYPANEILGKDLSILFPRDSRNETLDKIKKTLEGEQWESVEIPILHKYGSIRIALWNSANIYGVDKNLQATIAQGQDITTRKQTEKSLEEAKAQAELYLDLMGHDISNMHQIAIAQLELAQEIISDTGRLEGEEIELIDTPIESLQRSARIIDNVRKLQDLRSRDNWESLDLTAMISDVLTGFTSIPGRNITINYTPGDRSPVRANPLLKDVFTNLVDNAVKHSADPLILAVSVSKMNLNGNSYYRVAIDDNGHGIPDDKKEEVFHRFKRGQTKAKGTGLGLYIVKTLVECFGGYVEIQNRVLGDYTQGTRFLVYLPALEM